MLKSDRRNEKRRGEEDIVVLKRRWMGAALSFFFIAAVFGALMRLFFVVEIPFLSYKHLLHAHSHTALLGWGYMIVSGGLLFLLIHSKNISRTYRRLWNLNVTAGLGMAAAFVYQGYGPISIAFSTLHLISAYVFAYRFLNDEQLERGLSYRRFFRWAIIWQMVSTVGLWAIAPISFFLGKVHPLYHMSIQFFLHFQFNGWFSYALLGLLIYYLDAEGRKIRISKSAFVLLQLSLLLTYALSVTWSSPISVLFYFNSFGVLLQAAAYYLILKAIFESFNPFQRIRDWIDWLLVVGIGSLIFRIVIQTVVVWPAIATISYTIRNYVIGFIHLIMLGAVTLICAAIMIRKGLLPKDQVSKIGWLLLLSSFIVSEIILFGQGTLLWMKMGFIKGYYQLLFLVSSLFPVAILLLLAGMVTARVPQPVSQTER